MPFPVIFLQWFSFWEKVVGEDEPKFEFEPVDMSLIPPRARKY